MYAFLLIVQVAVAIALVVLILLQQGKGADAGAAFGSGASGTVFGSRGAGNFLSRTSAVLATLFFANSLLLSTPLVVTGGKETPSVTEQIAPAEPLKDEAVSDKKVLTDLPDAPAAASETPFSDLPDAPAAVSETPFSDLPDAPPPAPAEKVNEADKETPKQ